MKILSFISATIFLFSLDLCGQTSPSPNSWEKKEAFAGGKRERAVGFSIAGKGYLATGEDTADIVHKDLWEYDPALDLWTQKANLPGPPRRNAVAFTIGNKAYVGTGIDAAESFMGNTLNDFWEYDPVTNLWTQKANYPGGGGGGVYFATGFSVDSKGYVCAGKIGPSYYASDLWEYKPAADQWIQRAGFPGGVRYQLISFVVDQTAYVGLGTDENVYRKDLWAFNPGTNSWIQKNNFPGVNRASSSTFTIGPRGYVLFGSDGGFLDDLWEYNPYSDTWNIRAPFGGGERRNAIAFSIGNKGYAGTGKSLSGMKRNFYEYHPMDPVGVEEIKPEKIFIYPNPFSQSAIISESLNADFLEIYDASGRCVRKERIS